MNNKDDIAILTSIFTLSVGFLAVYTGSITKWKIMSDGK